MKKILPIFLVLLASCATQNKYPNKDICILLYDMKKDKFEEVFNEKHCQERFPAASTFKVALSVMGYDSGLLKNEEKPVFKWNGEKLFLEGWNKDQTPTTWMRESTVWVSQLMTPKIGMPKIQKYLNDWEYGNQDMTSGLKFAWLTPGPVTPGAIQNSLKISPYEQVTFLKKLWRRELKASAESQTMTQKIMTNETSSMGSILIGKTGSGYRGEKFNLRIGWFVGHLEAKQSEYIIVVNFTDLKPDTQGKFGGFESREIAKKILADKGLW